MTILKLRRTTSISRITSFVLTMITALCCNSEKFQLSTLIKERYMSISLHLINTLPSRRVKTATSFRNGTREFGLIVF